VNDARPVLRVLSGGPLTTVQDRGRRGWRRLGVPRSGAMDLFALHAANRLVGNAPDAAALEITAGGASFEALAPVTVAITGADLGATLDGDALPLWTSIFARPGAFVSLGGRRGAWGARAYLAISGGIAVPMVLGSRSTYLPGGWGGYDGRRLRTGDLVLHYPRPDPVTQAGRVWPRESLPAYGPAPILRVLPGPHVDLLASDVLEAFVSHAWTISASANRQGYRLTGPSIATKALSLPSLGVLPGVIQVPPDGMPILLLADAQTTGGYPIIGAVIEPDLPPAAQLLPGDALRFRRVTLADAMAARTAHESLLAAPLPDDADWRDLAERA